MKSSDRDVTPDGDDILAMYGSPTCSTPPPVSTALEAPEEVESRPPAIQVLAGLKDADASVDFPRLRPPRGSSLSSKQGSPDRESMLEGSQFDATSSNASSRRGSEAPTRQLRDIQKRLNSFAALASADASFASSRGGAGGISPNTSFQSPRPSQTPSSPSIIGSQISSVSSLTRQSAAESHLVSVISDARTTLRNDVLVAMIERVVADTISLYTTLGDDATARAAVDRVSVSLADFISRYVALAPKNTL